MTRKATPQKKSKDLYLAAGVDAARGDRLVDWLSADKAPPRSARGSSVSGIGGFAALFRPTLKGLKDPLLISCTDGVGTKLLLGIEHNQLEGLGVDLVATCANDLFTVGGHPLFFLDYFATGKLQDSQFKAILRGIKAGLHQCRSHLLGGETAELPGLYEHGHFDLAGFMVGLVDHKDVLGAHRVKDGDALVALESSGFHSNGYSLIRKWLKKTKRPSPKLIKNLLAPTKIYGEIPDMLARLPKDTIHAIAHISGGGISGNLPRVIPAGHVCEISRVELPTPDWMIDFLDANSARFDDVEEVFNLGSGMVCAINPKNLPAFMRSAKAHELGPSIIGRVRKDRGPARVMYF